MSAVALAHNRAWLRPDQVKVDPVVQRTFRPSHGNKLAKRYDPNRFGLGHVSLREDGYYYVIDGQHRCYAACKSGQGHIPVEFVVHTGLDRAQEAAKFSEVNVDRLAIDKFSDFRLRVTAGEPIAVDIVRILHSFGLVNATGPGSLGAITAISALEDVYMARIFGKGSVGTPTPDLLSRTLHTITSAWGKQKEAFERPLLIGVAALLLKYNGTCHTDRLGKRLAKHGSPSMLVGQIKSYSSVGKMNQVQAAMQHLRTIYNHKLSSGRLEETSAARPETGSVRPEDPSAARPGPCP